jgi:type I restriction enzyme, S subunit
MWKWYDIVKFKVLIPRPNEQAEIVAHLDRETTKVDTLISKYRRELDLLAEYRASLISHAVTGKIDVRCLAALPHPAEVEVV